MVLVCLRQFLQSRRFAKTTTSCMDPQSLVAQLNRYIIGQENAKRAIAVAVRDRWARLQVPDLDLRKEITPSNILLIGSSGCGKTEIARRLASIIDAPFVKVVATKYTEVGFVGDSTSSMVEELAEQSFLDATRRVRDEVHSLARSEALNDVARLFLLSHPSFASFHDLVALIDSDPSHLRSHLFSVDPLICPFFDLLPVTALSLAASSSTSRVSFKRHTSSASSRRPQQQMLRGESGGRVVDVESALSAGMAWHEERLLKQRESSVKTEAVEAAEARGIIFIDEFDKLVEDADNADDTGSFKSKRRGVQKELLTLIEGTAVQTNKLGRVNTDHILFICAGAWSYAKPTMMMPELQGRLQTQVTMEKLGRAEMVRIMKETEFNILKQQRALMKAGEEVELIFEEDGIEYLGKMAEILNTRICNTGARRLTQLVSIVLEDIKYKAQEYRGEQVIMNKDKISEILKKHKQLGKYVEIAETDEQHLQHDQYRKFVI